MNAKRTPDSYEARDRAVLRFVHRYGIGLPESVSTVFLAGHSSHHVLRRLDAKGLCTLHTRALPGGRSYVTLTEAGLAAIGDAKAKVRQLSPGALDLCIGTAVYCTLDATRRNRMLRREVEELLGANAALNVPHVMTREFGSTAVLRVYQALGKPDTVRRTVENFFHRARTQEGVAPFVVSKEYGLAVLCPTKEKQASVEELLKDCGHMGRLVVGLGPTAETLGTAIKKGGK